MIENSPIEYPAAQQGAKFSMQSLELAGLPRWVGPSLLWIEKCLLDIVFYSHVAAEPTDVIATALIENTYYAKGEHRDKVHNLTGQT